MPSTYTARNRAERQAPGENNNSWGSLLNAGTIDMFDQALDGMVSFSLSTSKTLATANGASDEARCRYINITGGSGGTVTIPNVEKVYVVRNASSGTAVFTTGSGTTCTVPVGTQAIVVCESGNMCRAFPFGSNDATLAALAAHNSNGLLTQTAADSFTGRTITAGSAKISISNGDGVAGNPTVNLGSVASSDLSDAASLYKSGGTDVAVADGGTGASTAADARANLGAAKSGANSDIISLSALSTPLSIAQGGTGAATAAAALAALDGLAVASYSAGANSLNIPIALPDGETLRVQGGTGALGANTAGSISFASAYTIAPLVLVSGGPSGTASEGDVHTTAAATTTGVAIVNSGNALAHYHWLAVGV